MRLFISYSRDDKPWVYELWRALRDRAHHDIWIDQRITPAQDWWESILQNIENCETFLYIMTPKSVESIYCRAELTYAVALKKPILPLMLKLCDTPSEVKTGRIQYYTLNDTDSLSDVMFTVAQGLTEIRVGLVQNKYPPADPLPARPDEPKPTLKPEQLLEVFMLAEEATNESNFSLAEKLFQEVMEADPQGYGIAAAERLSEVHYERTRNADYLNLVQMAANPTLRKGALALWRAYLVKYGIEYDPNHLSTTLSGALTATTTGATVKSSDLSTLRLIPPIDLLPEPFTWIDIPGKIGKNWKGTPYKIGKYPVTNAQFAKFIEAEGYKQQKWWTPEGWQQREQNNWTQPHYWMDETFSGSDYPVVGISWFEAVAFCLWLGDVTGEDIMLPKEDQWQYAAQGDDAREYPWGNLWDCQKCNNSVHPCDSSSTTPVHQYEGKGDSFFGAVDMVGNVWEWCLASYNIVNNNKIIDISKYYSVLCGTSWVNNYAVRFHCDVREWFSPAFRYDGIGFRLMVSSH